MAGAGKKTFTAGETLTASDVNTYLMEQSVMVFAGTAARSSAIPTPSDGMVTYNQTNNALEAYNGSEWINKSGLQLIKTQVVGTTVSSVTVTSAFSTTYDNYKIVYTGGTASTSADLRLTVGSAATNYYGNLIFARPNTAAPAGINNNNNSFWQYGGGLATTNGIISSFELYAPFLTARTSVFTQVMDLTGAASALGTWVGFHDAATSHTSFTLTVSGATITGGTIYVYGYSK
jgi:hypothetical protein